ncbi:hypothetical protein C2E23DRAFT_801857 [Lenzites betulinus]|nr:hypothetical protein C2E23DRAFT_801857 [Lenzites betulinus]
MDGLSEDPELAHEILKLLHNKLREARQELQDIELRTKRSGSEIALLDSSDLQQQNDKLRDELADLRLRMSAAAEGEDIKQTLLVGKPESSTPDSNVEEQLQQLNDLIANANERILKNNSRLKRYKSKYRELRSEKVGLELSLSTTTADIERETQSLKEHQSRVLAVEAELSALGPPAPQVPQFDLAAFMSTRGSMVGHLDVTTLQPLLKSTPLLELPEAILTQFGPVDLLVIRPEEVAWADGGVDRAALVTQPYRFDPTARKNTGTWTVNSSLNDLIDNVGRAQELFIRQQDDWYYYGTYQCVGYSPLLETSDTIPHSVVRHVTQATAIHKDHIAPVALKFIDSLYTPEGPLKLQYFALERTGFHREFYEAIRSSVKELQAINAAAAKRGKTVSSIIRRLSLKESSKKRERNPSPGLVSSTHKSKRKK